MCDELVKALRETRERVKSDPSLAMHIPPYQLSAAADAIEELQAAEKKYLANISALETENQHLKREREWMPVKSARDFNTVKSDLIRHLYMSCQKTDGEILWYEGTLEVLAEFLSILHQKRQRRASDERTTGKEETLQSASDVDCRL